MTLKFFRFIGIFLILFSVIPVFSNNNFIYKVDRLSVEHGLPHIDITGIVEDNKGFMWFSTLSGICRYDGSNIITYTNEDPYNLKKNRTNSIDIDKSGNFWVGTQGGIALFSPQKEHFIPIKHNFTKFDIKLTSDTQIKLIDSNNIIWANIGSKSYLIEIKDDSIKNIINISEQLQLENNSIIISIKEDKNENFWIGTNMGIIQAQMADNLNNNLSIKSIHTYELNSNFISSLLINSKGNLIAGSYQCYHEFELDYSTKLTKIVNQKTNYIETNAVFQTTNKNDEIKFTILHAAAEDFNGNYWFGTDGGLLMHQKNKLEKNKDYILYTSSLNTPFSLSAELANVIYINKNNSMFIGTFGGGINIIDLKQKQISWLYKTNEDKKSSLVDNLIRAIEEDEKANIWIGTQNHGLSYYDLQNRINHQINLQGEEGINRHKIRSLYLENNKYLWIGTQNEILCFDVKLRKLIPLPKEFTNATKLNNGYYSDIEIDAYNNLWLSTWRNGIFQCIRPQNSKTNFSEINQYHTHCNGEIKLINNNVNKIALSVNKNTIYATTINGIEKLNLDTLGRVKSIYHYISSLKKGEPSSNFIWDLIEIDKHTQWIGTIGGGFYKILLSENIDNQGFGSIQTLPLNIPNSTHFTDIECLITDKNKNLWIGSKTLNFYDTKNNKLQPYDFEESVFQNSFKVGAAHAGKSGNIYLGGIKGINYFNPDKLIYNASVPYIEISELWVHNKPVKVGQEYKKRVILNKSISYTNSITLNYLQNNFTLAFTANLFENPAKVNYKYKLEGIDKNWSHTTGKNPKVTYANLPYKTYIFKVQASNNDGIWSNKSREIEIKILPPWWKSRFAKMVYGLLIILITYGAYLNLSNYYKIKHDLELAKIEEANKEEIHQTKLQFFTNISHEFRTPLSLIMAPLEELMNKDQNFLNRKKLYAVIDKNAKKLLSLVNELIEFRRLENKTIRLKTTKQELNNLIKEAAEPFRQISENKKINYKITYSERQINGWFDSSIIDKILSNLISNAFKHTSENGLITIDVIDKNMEAYLNKNTPRFTIENETKAEKYIGILIKDSGTGITQKSLPHIFDRFFQVDKDPTRHLGSGIGLAIVKNFVLLHKGELIVESKRDEGTSFLVKLPLSAELYSKDEKSSNQSILQSEQKSNSYMLLEDSTVIENYSTNEFRTKTIYIIEDEEGIREFLVSKLSEKFITTGFSNAAEAMEQLKTATPDLIISDIMMPGINGFDFCKSIKEDLNMCHIPVILLTAKSELEDLISGAESGADLFVTKPFSINYLFVSIHNLLQTRRKLIEKYKNDSLFELGTISKSDADKKIIDKILKLIKENLEDPTFSVEFLSSELGIGRTKLYKLVKTITGLTLGDVIRDVKMKVAAQLLISSDLTISDIASKVGVSPNFFYAMFKEYYGKTPSEFQKENLG